MIGRRTHIVALVLVILTSTSVTAQPKLEIEPDSIYYSNQDVTDNRVFLVNSGNESLLVDSLHFSVFQPSFWGINVKSADTTISYEFQFGVLTHGSFDDFVVNPNDTLAVDIWGYGSCIICKAQSNNLQVWDSLFVFSNDPSQFVHTAPIDFTYYVSVDPPQTVASKLEVFPNPVEENTTIRLSTEVHIPEAIITVFDILGRRVIHQHLSVDPGGFSLPLDVDLRSGTYIVVLESDGRIVGQAKFVNL